MELMAPHQFLLSPTYAETQPILLEISLDVDNSEFLQTGRHQRLPLKVWQGPGRLELIGASPRLVRVYPRFVLAFRSPNSGGGLSFRIRGT